MSALTYPARPINGGPLPQAMKYPKPGRWVYEPKVNGWRTLVHTMTGEMYNRHGKPLSIANEFKVVLDRLQATLPFEWLDCEAFERRHPLGKGSLVVLDAPLAQGTYSTYNERQQAIYDKLVAPGIAQSWGFEQFEPPTDSLLSFAYHYDFDDNDPAMHPIAAWNRLQAVNRALGCEVFEGLVAKRVDSPYPIQLRSPDQEYAGWVKHRWHF